MPRAAWALTALAFAAVTWAETDQAAPVTLREDPFRLVLENGIVSLEIAKENGSVVHLAYRGKSLLSSPAYLDWHDGSNHHFRAPRCRIVTDPATNGGELAEISLQLHLDEERRFEARRQAPRFVIAAMGD